MALTAKQRRIRQKLAKDLRDRLVTTIESWLQTNGANDELASLPAQDRSVVLDAVVADAYESLVWKTLSKADRYATPYYRQILEDLRRDHPDLELVGSTKSFVRWPVFRQEDIDRAFDSSVEALDWTDHRRSD